MSDNLNQKSDSLNQRNEQVLAYISQLQKEEMDLYNSLNNPMLSADEKQMKINRINELSQIRLNLYESIKDLLDTYKQNSENSSNTLNQQVMAVNIMEEELNSAKNLLNYIDSQKTNKIRQAEINTYYGKRYNAHAKVMKTIVIFCIPIILLAMLYNWNLLPTLVYGFLVGIIIIIGVIVIGYQLIDITSRSNMNWDEFDWVSDPIKYSQGTGVTVTSTFKNPWTSVGTCVGAQCCFEGTTYDETKDQCVPSNIEAFTALEKYAKMPIKATNINSNINPQKSSLSLGNK